MKKKKIGIVVDDYKLDWFKKTLKKSGYDIELFPATNKTTAIIFYVEEEKFESSKLEVKTICEEGETYFNARKARKN